MLAQSGDNAGGMEPAGIQGLFPVDIAGLNLAQGGVAPVIDLVAGSGADAHFHKGKAVPGAADLVKGFHHHVGHIHTMHLGVLDNVGAGPVVHQLGDIGGFQLGHQPVHAQVGDVDTAVQFGGGNAELQFFRLTKPVMIGRSEADIGFAKTHEIIFCHSFLLLVVIWKGCSKRFR